MIISFITQALVLILQNVLTLSLTFGENKLKCFFQLPKKLSCLTSVSKDRSLPFERLATLTLKYKTRLKMIAREKNTLAYYPRASVTQKKGLLNFFLR
jgi:hypothetical protein